jgi:hypothetical protein
MTLGMALLSTGNITHHALAPAVQAVDEARLVAVLSREGMTCSAPAREAPSHARARR